MKRLPIECSRRRLSAARLFARDSTERSDGPKIRRMACASRPGAELAEAEREADFYSSTRSPRALHEIHRSRLRKKSATAMRMCLKRLSPEAASPDKMYFDAQTGLPIRIVSQHHRPRAYPAFRRISRIIAKWMESSCRSRSRRPARDSAFTIKISEVHHNVELEDGEFAKPAVQ